MKTFSLRALSATMALAVGCWHPATVQAAGFIFAGEDNGNSDIVTHPQGYTGTGGTLNVSVGIDPTSVNASDMVVSTQNVINTINAMAVTTGNLQAANVPGSQWDFESVLLHEMGHALGLAHCNLATESGLLGEDREYTKASDGDGDGDQNEPGEFNLDPGTDARRGSSDDIRGNDINLNWFRKGVNNPAAALPSTVDHSTFSRSLADLPGGHTYAANGEEDVLGDLGVANTEAIMQQGSPPAEAQRTMIAEDVAALRVAMAGLDETQGTADDYTINLTYAGLTTNADIVIDFDGAQTGFAVTLVSGFFINSDHVRLADRSGFTYIPIFFDPNAVTWFFNQTSNGGDPDNVFVDFTAGTNGGGSEVSPFNNLADAVAFANNGADINIDPGSSSETFTGGSALGSGNQPMTLLNNNSGGGSVRIGVP